MYNNLKVVIMGNYVKITSLKLKNASTMGEAITFKKLNDEKLKNNLIRAKNNITELALSNPFDYFFTLTFDTKYDRFDLKKLLYLFRNQIKYMREKGDYNLKYLIVPEQHKNGAWHFHGFLTADFVNFFKTNEYGYLFIEEFKKLGYHNIQVIQSRERIASYVTKYVSKNLSNGIDKYNHCYYGSLGLNKGEKIEDFIYNNTHFDRYFFNWSNDYCSKRIMSIDEYNNIKGSIIMLKKFDN